MTIFLVALLGIFVLVALSVAMVLVGGLIQNMMVQTKTYFVTLKAQIVERQRLRKKRNRTV